MKLWTSKPEWDYNIHNQQNMEYFDDVGQNIQETEFLLKFLSLEIEVLHLRSNFEQL